MPVWLAIALATAANVVAQSVIEQYKQKRKK
jgi:hypothetical protein